MEYESIPRVELEPPAAAPAPRRSWARLAAVPVMVALCAFAGVAGYSQLSKSAARPTTPARAMITHLARTIAAKTQGDDYYAPGLSCTSMEETFNRCVDYESSFS